jgi:predicted TIM-barrel fold metal-dependent hydrolase
VWLESRIEEVIDPDQPIIDAHHHMFDRPGWRYLQAELLDDLGTGHDIRGTVFVQARAMLRTTGPEAMRPVGETEFAAGIAANAASSGIAVCCGIVGQADLLAGDAVQRVLEAHVMAGGGRFRGIRHVAAWDPDPSRLNPAYPSTEDLLDRPNFRAGFARLQPLGLSFDAWLFFHQLPRLTILARAFPDTTIVLDHCGGVLGTGAYAGRRAEVFARWSAGLRALADCPNVLVKLGGLGMSLSGFSFEAGEAAPSSAALAESWRPWIEECIDAFGPARCMFESNFPMDKASYGYRVGWNAMKRLTAAASPDEKADLFWRTAARAYRLAVPGLTDRADPERCRRGSESRSQADDSISPMHARRSAG